MVLWEESSPPRALAGTPGITVVQVALGEGFICLLTDHGILLTRGSGASGCLGHGEARDVGTPRIVEALLGEDVVEVKAGPRHVAVVTSDGEGFTWGQVNTEDVKISYQQLSTVLLSIFTFQQLIFVQDTGGCLGHDHPNRLSPLPQVVSH